MFLCVAVADIGAASLLTAGQFYPPTPSVLYCALNMRTNNFNHFLQFDLLMCLHFNHISNKRGVYIHHLFFSSNVRMNLRSAVRIEC